MAYPFLAPATESAERVAEKVKRTVRELKICMFCLGVRTLAELRGTKLLKGS
jgi:isopentenyl diphosphate isomerase/L-lactate dehydrogenase-like FMN-dependent dehydrogenase